MAVRPELMEILACPKCKQPVALAGDGQSITCDTCKLRYPVRDDIPVMLIDEAESFAE
ncbi:MAG: Trm112 family protein [Desulfuromonadales bacterium]|nr:Trm112 family protein [Desulfuromonadales bacterium]